MAGSASRIYNFCRSNPNSSGCPWPPYLGNQPAPKICDDFPFEIGTSTGCSVYNVYWFKNEYAESAQPIPAWSGAGDGTGVIINSVAPLYSGVYSGTPTPQIGNFKLITSVFQYDSTTPTKFLATDNYSFYWINGQQIVASMDSTYDYIGDGLSQFFAPGSYHYFNSTTSAYHLLNKSVSVQLYAALDDNVRQCKLTIKNT